MSAAHSAPRGDVLTIPTDYVGRRLRRAFLLLGSPRRDPARKQGGPRVHRGNETSQSLPPASKSQRNRGWRCFASTWMSTSTQIAFTEHGLRSIGQLLRGLMLLSDCLDPGDMINRVEFV